MGEQSHLSMDFDKVSMVFILSPFQLLSIDTNSDIKVCIEFGIFSQKFGSSESLELLAAVKDIFHHSIFFFWSVDCLGVV